MGKPVGDDAAFTDLRSLQGDSNSVNVRGIVFKTEKIREIQDGTKVIGMIGITDRKGSAGIKLFCVPEKWKDIENNVEVGDFVKIHGKSEEDKYEKGEIVVIADSIEKGERPAGRMDTAEEKRVELHAHTQMSAMDGLNSASNLVHTAAMWGQPAVAITDHGVVQSFPDAAAQAGKEAKAGRNIKIIYGMEGYLVKSEECTDAEGNIDYKKPRSYHIIIIAKNQDGLKNLYKLVSISHLNYFYKKPRLPRSVIEEHREGLIIGSACSAGELYEAILEGRSDEEVERIASFYDYLEIQPLINNRFLTEDSVTSKGEPKPRRVQDTEGLRDINRRIVALADKLGKPVVATTDSHYAEPEDAIYRNILMAGMGFKDAEDGEGLFMRTTDEMLEEFAYLGEETAHRVVIDNPQAIMNMTEEILPVPKGKFPPKIEGAVETLKKTCYDRAHAIYGDPLPEYIQDRLDREVNSVCDNGYAVMYVSAQMLVKKSNDDGYLVGSRGSVGSSFAATMAGI
ncbi:MAG: PHP domain-containing protein, partial [Firmicutes bacterium]|nr:PHP domain-containing protein [Bacillota bacterium]